MIDAAALRARGERAREVQVEVEPGKSFTIRMPTQFELVLAERRVRIKYAGDPTQALLLQRAITEPAVVAWSGLTVGDVLPGADDAAEVLDYQRDLVDMVLDAQTAWSLRLGSELFDQLTHRRAATEEDAKN